MKTEIIIRPKNAPEFIIETDDRNYAEALLSLEMLQNSYPKAEVAVHKCPKEKSDAAALRARIARERIARNVAANCGRAANERAQRVESETID